MLHDLTYATTSWFPPDTLAFAMQISFRFGIRPKQKSVPAHPSRVSRSYKFFSIAVLYRKVDSTINCVHKGMVGGDYEGKRMIYADSICACYI
jgi:hypothetical protein